MIGSELDCDCTHPSHATTFIVLTGGPGAGKTAVLETVRRQFCEHVAVLPEAASMLFRGGFPRLASSLGRACAQRAIYHVQRELEQLATGDPPYAVVLCDRGTLDGLAYWPHEPARYFAELGTSEANELARYAAVIHLRSPGLAHGYNHQNPMRIESAEEAVAIDQRVARAWAAHPHVHTVDSHADFLHKLQKALELIRAEVPPCCAPEARR